MSTQVNPFVDGYKAKELDNKQNENIPNLATTDNTVAVPELNAFQQLAVVPQIDINALKTLPPEVATQYLQIQAAMYKLTIPPKQQKKKVDLKLEAKEYILKLDYVRDVSHRCFAVVNVNGILEYVPVDDNSFIGAVNRHISEKFSAYLKESDIRTVINAEKPSLEAKSKFLPYIKRYATTETHLYLDMRVYPQKFIKVDFATGEKSYVTSVPFIPRRFGTQKPLPELKQSDGNNFRRFFELMQVKDVEKQCLIETFLISKLMGYITPYLHFIGPQGSGKTTLAHYLKNIIDNSEAVSHLPSKPNDLVLLYDQTALPVIDNVSKINREYADVFCGTFSGHDFKKRKEFTVDEAYSFIVKNSGILTSISSVQSYADMVARVFYMEFETLAESGMPESLLNKHFNELSPYLLDELLDLYVLVHSKFNIDDTVRTADRSKEFVKIGNIIAELRYNDENLFEKIIFKNDSFRYGVSITQNETVYSIAQFMDDKSSYEGTVSELVSEIHKSGITVSVFNKRPEQFAKNMKKYAHLLAEVGITFVKGSNWRSNSFYKIINNEYELDS